MGLQQGDYYEYCPTYLLQVHECNNVGISSAIARGSGTERARLSLNTHAGPSQKAYMSSMQALQALLIYKPKSSHRCTA